MVLKKLRVSELEAEVVVNIHHGLELKHSQFPIVNGMFTVPNPSCFFELVFRTFVSLCLEKSLWL